MVFVNISFIFPEVQYIALAGSTANNIPYLATATVDHSTRTSTKFSTWVVSPNLGQATFGLSRLREVGK